MSRRASSATITNATETANAPNAETYQNIAIATEIMIMSDRAFSILFCIYAFIGLYIVLGAGYLWEKEDAYNRGEKCPSLREYLITRIVGGLILFAIFMVAATLSYDGPDGCGVKDWKCSEIGDDDVPRI